MLVGDIGQGLETDKFSGIIGLAPQNDPNNPMVSFIEQVSKSEELPPVFSFYLPKDSNGKLMIGGYDLSQFAKAGAKESDITWSPVASDEKTWSATFNGLKFKDGTPVATDSEKIMLDTGLTYALVPSKDVDSVAKSLRGYSIECTPPTFTGKLGLYQCTCSSGSFNSLKPLQLFIGGQYFDMPVSSYIQRTDDDDHCKLLLHPYDTSYGSDSKWVLGAQFLQNYYSIYDYQNHRIGLVQSR